MFCVSSDNIIVWNDDSYYEKGHFVFSAIFDLIGATFVLFLTLKGTSFQKHTNMDPFYY